MSYPGRSGGNLCRSARSRQVLEVVVLLRISTFCALSISCIISTSRVHGQLTCQLQELMASAPTDYWGWSVSASGDRIAVGQVSQDSTTDVYVFVREQGAWIEETRIPAPTINSRNQFGRAQSLSGGRLAVAAEDEENNRGAVYVYHRNSAAWTTEARIVPDDAVAGDGYGRSVGLRDDLLVVGAITAGDHGAVYVFRRVRKSWAQEAKLVPLGSARDAEFGHSIAVGDDLIVVCAHRDMVDGVMSGACYVFESAGANWIQSARLVPPDGADGDVFGESVAVDDGMLLIGAGHVNANTGAAYSFLRDSSGNWLPNQTITASDTVVGDLFGEAVALYGSFAAIGARQHKIGGLEIGTAYVFERDGDQLTEWAKLLPEDGVHGDAFGLSVAVSDKFVVVGAVSANAESGAAYVFAVGHDDCNENALVDSCEADADFDGVIDACDACEGFDDGQDADGDSLPDECDLCPYDASNDSDGDGVCAPIDECPDDPHKTIPGVCGCGVPDVGDSDNDATLDCIDQCPGLDDSLDQDKDGIPDCLEPSIPAVSEWGMLVLALLLATIAKLVFGCRAIDIRPLVHRASHGGLS